MWPSSPASSARAVASSESSGFTSTETTPRPHRARAHGEKPLARARVESGAPEVARGFSYEARGAEAVVPETAVLLRPGTE